MRRLACDVVRRDDRPAMLPTLQGDPRRQTHIRIEPENMRRAELQRLFEKAFAPDVDIRRGEKADDDVRTPRSLFSGVADELREVDGKGSRHEIACRPPDCQTHRLRSRYSSRLIYRSLPRCARATT